MAAHGGEVIPALFAQRSRDQRRSLPELDASGIFAVQQAKRVFTKASSAVIAQFLLHALVVAHQLREVAAAAFRAADGVDQKRVAGDAEPLCDGVHERDDLVVVVGVLASEELGPELVELAKPSLLGALGAEHGARVEELARRQAVVLAVFHVGAHHRRGAFRAEGEAASAAVLEGEHLLGHYVGLVAYPARKHLGEFHHRDNDLAVVVEAHRLARGRQDAVPAGDAVGKYVLDSRGS